MTSRSWRNRRTTRWSTPRWNRPEIPLWTILWTVLIAPSLFAQDAPAANGSPAPTIASPFGESKTYSAAVARWERLKAEAAAAAKAREAAAAKAKAEAAAKAAQAAEEAAAAETEVAEEAEATVVESADFERTEVVEAEADTAMAAEVEADDAAPAEKQPLAPDFFDDTLPSDRDEPAWIIPSRELTADEANLSDEPKSAPSQWKPTSHGNKWLPRQTVVPVPHSSDRDETTVISASAEATDAATLAPLLTSQDTTSRAIRAMKDISPDYDLTVDQDIRTYADEQAAKFGVKFGDQPFEPRTFPETVMPWEAPNLYNYPLYFEDPALERYGHTRPFFVQPFVSAGRFTGQLLALPYQMAIDPIGEEVYALGYYRPGDMAPKLKYKVPWNTKAAVVEATVVTGLIFLIP